jgi:ABC-2 type transport system ATP-binding protein
MANGGRAAVLAEGLVKRYGGSTVALDGFSLRVERGTVCGLLGPNGAGKTTAVRILSTLLRFDAGRAEVAGFDVARDGEEVRRRIGLAGQSAAVDETLTGRENLVMFGRLYHLAPRIAKARADELLEQFDLSEAARKPAKQYSGGMRRRLDLAASLILAPEVLFLDEPTTGLDPRSRLEVWQAVRTLVAGGTTVLLTTQYLDEADQLATQIAVIDSGKVIAEGTPAELKGRVGGDRVELVVGPTDLVRVAAIVNGVAAGKAEIDTEARRISAPVVSRVGTLTEILKGLDAAGIEPEDVTLRGPTLDDVFLRLTGQRTKDLAA